MNATLRKQVKIADLIRDQLLDRQERLSEGLKTKIAYTVDKISRILALARTIRKSNERGWSRAVTRLKSELREATAGLRHELEILESGLADSPGRRSPTLTELVSEIQTLEKEFGGWGFDQQEKTLTVATEPVELDGVHLGSFEISLKVRGIAELDRGPPYSVVAVDPNPAEGNQHVTHPHVSDEQLCPGEAGPAIRAALEEGRLCDFFLLVSTVLQNYNPESAYVKLSDWHSATCDDCGYSVGEFEYCCEGCENTFCNECTGFCQSCEAVLCSSCLDECSVCEDCFCQNCLTPCRKCGEQCCDSCLEKQICSSCKESEDENTTTETVSRA